MAKIFKQIRYFGLNSTQNNTTRNDLTTGLAVKNNTPLTQLGIRALPGTKFYINGESEPVIVGYTGIFELDFKDVNGVYSIKFDPKSVLAVENIPGGYIIIDMLGQG